MKKIFLFLQLLTWSPITCLLIRAQTANLQTVVTLQVDASKRMHQLDGIGVNVNTRGWRGKELEPAMNILLDSMKFSIWRVIVETVEKWEDVNDNKDPFVFNWDYYNRIYQTEKFARAWGMMKYLNAHGITQNLMINFMGSVPLWMGGEFVRPEYEDEYVEMLTSFFYYARNTQHIEFGLISLMNEPDLHKEGPNVDPIQYLRVIKKLMNRMAAVGLADIRYVAPDVASLETAMHHYLPVLMQDSSVMNNIAHIGLHSYGGYYAPVDSAIRHSTYPNANYWITEWNAWRDGLDDGLIGVYDFPFARQAIAQLLDLINHGAHAAMIWEGFDSYYEHHTPSVFSYWGILGYDPGTGTYYPRKHVYAIQQLSRFVAPGAWQVSMSVNGDSLIALAFTDGMAKQTTIVGINTRSSAVSLNVSLLNQRISSAEQFHTNEWDNLHKDSTAFVHGNTLTTSIPANSIFTISNSTSGFTFKPEPPGWYTGDIHVHRNCGDGTDVLPEEKLAEMMEPNQLDVIAVLADMGNGEVKYSKDDLLKVNGKDAPQSIPGKIIHWDTEWHWDATYSNFDHQALGGHLVLLGLQEAHQIWDESPYKILDWAKSQHAVRGFAHMEYLNDKIPTELNCCIPIDYPVEAALETIDFISEDVYAVGSPNNGNYNSEATINAYYKLLNCGFRLGLAAGTDYPCNNSEAFGSLLTYVQVKDHPLSYSQWIDGIKNGRTVVSRNGHRAFLELTVNGKFSPGDEIKIKYPGSVMIEAKWTGSESYSGTIELVANGMIIAHQEGTVHPGSAMTLRIDQSFKQSSWLCARIMDKNGHQLHTAPIYIMVNNRPIRASGNDAGFFVSWIDNILSGISPGGKWERYFTHDQEKVKQRYLKARKIFMKISEDAKKINN